MQQEIGLSLLLLQPGPSSIIISCTGGTKDVRFTTGRGRVHLGRNRIKTFDGEIARTIEGTVTKIESDNEPIVIDFDYTERGFLESATLMLHGECRVFIDAESNGVKVMGKGRVVSTRNCQVTRI
jgi:hypothetical protein